MDEYHKYFVEQKVPARHFSPYRVTHVYDVQAKLICRERSKSPER